MPSVNPRFSIGDIVTAINSEGEISHVTLIDKALGYKIPVMKIVSISGDWYRAEVINYGFTCYHKFDTKTERPYSGNTRSLAVFDEKTFKEASDKFNIQKQEEKERQEILSKLKKLTITELRTIFNSLNK